MLLTQFKCGLNTTKYFSLEDLAALFFSNYVQGESKEKKRVNLSFPSFPNNMYEGRVEGSIEGYPAANVYHLIHCDERGSRGFSTYYEVKFEIDNFSCSILKKNSDLIVGIRIPNQEMDSVKSVFDQLEAELPTSGYKVESAPISINSNLGFQYFSLLKDNINLVSDAFDLNSDFKDVNIIKNEENKKELLFRSEAASIRLTYYTILQPEFKRNYTGLYLEINQSTNKKVSSNFKLFFYHSNSHEIGQNDFKVNTVRFESQRQINPQSEKYTLISLNSLLLLLGAI